MPKIAIIGGGIAGCTTALEISKKEGYEVVIFEQSASLLQGTSARTPGRMGLGYHYFDFDTAKLYMEQTVNFMKTYPDYFLGDREHPYLQNGRYFIVKDSLVDAQNLMNTYDRISREYENMVRLDPSNDIFGTMHLHRSLNRAEYENDIDDSKISFAIETKERLLDWKAFSDHLIGDINKCSNIKTILNCKVDDVSSDKYGKFLLSSNISSINQETADEEVDNSVPEDSFDFIVNCSWQNIDLINQSLGIGSANSYKEDPNKSTTSRLKLLAEVEIPDSLKNSHSMFFCVGPHAMFSNLGNGIGRLTYAPVTNFSTTTEIKMPEEFERWLTEGLNEDEVIEYGQAIINGVSDYIPAMKDAKLISVMPGIVKSKGDVQISNKDSSFHKRDYSGVVEQQMGWVDNAAMKLFYCLGNAKNVAEIIETQNSTWEKVIAPAMKLLLKSKDRNLLFRNAAESSPAEDEKNVLEEKMVRIKGQFLTNYIQRNFEASWIMENQIIFYEDLKSGVENKNNLIGEIKSPINNIHLNNPGIKDKKDLIKEIPNTNIRLRGIDNNSASIINNKGAKTL